MPYPSPGTSGHIKAAGALCEYIETTLAGLLPDTTSEDYSGVSRWKRIAGAEATALKYLNPKW
jgi:hypothetical protein